jgi:hypothetical protein
MSWDRQAANPPLCLAPSLRQASIQTVIVYIAGVNDYSLGAIFERALLREIIKISLRLTRVARFDAPQHAAFEWDNE